MKDWIKYLAKLWPALAAALAQAGISVAPESDHGTSITGTETLQIVLAAVAALGVWKLRNGPRPGTAAPVTPAAGGGGPTEPERTT